MQKKTLTLTACWPLVGSGQRGGTWWSLWPPAKAQLGVKTKHLLLSSSPKIVVFSPQRCRSVRSNGRRSPCSRCSGSSSLLRCPSEFSWSCCPCPAKCLVNHENDDNCQSYCPSRFIFHAVDCDEGDVDKNKTDALRLLLNPTLEPIFSFMVMITSPQNKNSLLPTLHCPPKPKVGGIMENILHNSSKSMIVKDILQSESLQNDCKYWSWFQCGGRTKGSEFTFRSSFGGSWAM